MSLFLSSSRFMQSCLHVFRHLFAVTKLLRLVKSMNRSALVIGSGPNGMSAAIVLAQAGWRVLVREASDRIGGGASSAELTLPGFVHDVGSAVHPLAVASPFFSSLPLDVRWIHGTAPLAHPLDDGTAVMLHRDLGETARNLGTDGIPWAKLYGPVVRDWEIFRHELLKPLGWTKHPFRMARFGLNAVLSAEFLADSRFAGERARALFTGLAAHYPFLNQPLSAGFGLVLGASAHAVGWPIPEGGAQAISDYLVSKLRALGGDVVTASRVESLAGEEGSVMEDVSPRALAEIAGARLPVDFRKRLGRYRYGPGSFKMDWALREPIPWRARECALAATVHIGGSAEEIRASERSAVRGEVSERPFVLLSQPTLFDASRAPLGKHVVWAYCHTPAGSKVDRAEHIERQIERFAPGFRDCILARHVAGPSDLELGNENLVGGDVTGGISDISQTLFRPTWRRYGTPDRAIYLCSSSTPPGAGVHGMCGYYAALGALRNS